MRHVEQQDQVLDIRGHILDETVLGKDQVCGGCWFDGLLGDIEAQVALDAVESENSKHRLHNLLIMGSRDAGSEINAAVNNATLTVGLGEVLDKLTGAHHVDLVISHT